MQIIAMVATSVYFLVISNVFELPFNIQYKVGVDYSWKFLRFTVHDHLQLSNMD